MSQANPHQYGDYAMLILLYGATVDTVIEFQRDEIVTSTTTAYDLYFQRGIPNHIVLRSSVSLQGMDELRGLRTLVDSIESSMEYLERQYQFLTAPLIVSMEDKGNSAELQTLTGKLEQLSRDYQERPVMARRHDKVYHEFAGAFETFARTGRWGMCSDCPKTQYHGIFTYYPELCKHTGRHDHNLKADDLFARYKDRMERPYK